MGWLPLFLFLFLFLFLYSERRRMAGGVSVSDGCDRYHKDPGLTGNGVRLVINLKKFKKHLKF
jgi:hypothetical protein